MPLIMHNPPSSGSSSDDDTVVLAPVHRRREADQGSPNQPRRPIETLQTTPRDMNAIKPAPQSRGQPYFRGPTSATPARRTRSHARLSSTDLAKAILGVLAEAPVVKEALEARQMWTAEELQIVKSILVADWTLLDDYEGFKAKMAELGVDGGETSRGEDNGEPSGEERPAKRLRFSGSNGDYESADLDADATSWPAIFSADNPFHRQQRQTHRHGDVPTRRSLRQQSLADGSSSAPDVSMAMKYFKDGPIHPLVLEALEKDANLQRNPDALASMMIVVNEHPELDDDYSAFKELVEERFAEDGVNTSDVFIARKKPQMRDAGTQSLHQGITYAEMEKQMAELMEEARLTGQDIQDRLQACEERERACIEREAQSAAVLEAHREEMRTLRARALQLNAQMAQRALPSIIMQQALPALITQRNSPPQLTPLVPAQQAPSHQAGSQQAAPYPAPARLSPAALLRQTLQRHMGQFERTQSHQTQPQRPPPVQQVQPRVVPDPIPAIWPSGGVMDTRAERQTAGLMGQANQRRRLEDVPPAPSGPNETRQSQLLRPGAPVESQAARDQARMMQERFNNDGAQESFWDHAMRAMGMDESAGPAAGQSVEEDDDAMMF